MGKFKPQRAKKILDPTGKPASKGLLTKDGQPITPPRPIRVGIAVCSRDTVKAGFAFDLARLIAFTSVHGVAQGHLELVLLNNRGTLIVNQRHELVIQAMKDRCDAILWLDDDMRFPMDSLFRLMNHDKPVVACNYTTRKPPCHPVAFTNVNRDNPAGFRYVWTLPESTGLEQVDTVGMGVMLTHINVFLGMKPPAFQLLWNEKGHGFEGEDIYFCMKLKETGVAVYIDHDLSKLVKHEGLHEYENLVDGLIWKEQSEELQTRKREQFEATQKLREAGLFNLPTTVEGDPDEDEVLNVDDQGGPAGSGS